MVVLFCFTERSDTGSRQPKDDKKIIDKMIGDITGVHEEGMQSACIARSITRRMSNAPAHKAGAGQGVCRAGIGREGDYRGQGRGPGKEYSKKMKVFVLFARIRGTV